MSDEGVNQLREIDLALIDFGCKFMPQDIVVSTTPSGHVEKYTVDPILYEEVKRQNMTNSDGTIPEDKINKINYLDPRLRDNGSYLYIDGEPEKEISPFLIDYTISGQIPAERVYVHKNENGEIEYYITSPSPKYSICYIMLGENKHILSIGFKNIEDIRKIDEENLYFDGENYYMLDEKGNPTKHKIDSLLINFMPEKNKRK